MTTANTGGNIMCDFVTLDDGTILVVSGELVALYASWEDFENGVTVVAEKGSLANCILRPVSAER
jgi:hypothetical protein